MVSNRSKTKSRIVIAGGGTGGHLYPALAIAQGLIDKGLRPGEIVFFGSSHGIEKNIVPEHGYKYTELYGKGLNRGEYFKNIIHVIQLLSSCIKVLILFLYKRPDVVIGVGGYASSPAVIGASILFIPRIVHEQNSYLGRSNRLAQSLGATVLSTFENTEGLKGKYIRTGLPLRSDFKNEIKARNEYLATRNEKTLVVSGGSLGSKIINQHVSDMVQKYKEQINFSIVHISGTNNYEEMKHFYKANNIDELVDLRPYENELIALYATSDCVVSRAGAGTCVELEILGTSSVLIPLPSAPGDHQRKNASYLVEAGACTLIDQDKLNPELLYEIVNKMMDVDNKPYPENFHLGARARIAEYIYSNFLLKSDGKNENN